MIHWHTEIWKGQGSASTLPLIQEILLSLQIGFSFVRAAVACAILVLVGWLFWVKQLFETVFQSISGRLLERGRNKLVGWLFWV